MPPTKIVHLRTPVTWRVAIRQIGQWSTLSQLTAPDYDGASIVLSPYGPYDKLYAVFELGLDVRVGHNPADPKHWIDGLVVNYEVAGVACDDVRFELWCETLLPDGSVVDQLVWGREDGDYQTPHGQAVQRGALGKHHLEINVPNVPVGALDAPRLRVVWDRTYTQYGHLFISPGILRHHYAE